MRTLPPRTGETAPAILDGDPANLFAFFPTYQRGAMTLQGYREIVGDQKFALGRELLDRFAYDNLSTAEFIALAKEISQVLGAELGLLDDYFQQWLYGETKPTLLPEDFGGQARSLSERLGLDQVELRLADRPGVEQLLRLGDLARRAAGGVTDVLVHRRPLGLGLLE